MSGGGGDNGYYEAKQADLEAKKQTSRDKLNYLFGVGGGGAGAEVDRKPFTTQAAPAATSYGEGDEQTYQPGAEVFDQSGYDTAVAKANADAEGANQNKGARDQLYQTVRDNAFSAGKRRLGEAQADAARKLKFELFASGQAGGSGDIDQNAKLRRTYTGGLMDLGAKADAAKADFRQGDETTRLNLLQSIDNGMDQGSALSSAINQMQVEGDKASATAAGTDLGNLFDNAKLMYTEQQRRRGIEDARQKAWETFPQAGRSGAGTAATGLTTKLPGE